jgi:hypothetical protein
MAPQPLPSPSRLDELDDAELKRLAVFWRAQALRGDREAHAVAHALKVAYRRRLRESQLARLPAEPAAPPQPWWKFWAPEAPRSRS